MTSVMWRAVSDRRDDAGGGRRGLRARPSAELFETLRRQYGVEPRGRVSDLGGSSSLNLPVTDGAGRFVARVYRPYVTTGRLGAIQLARNALLAGGVPATETVPAKDGRTWIEFGDRLVEVERFVEHDARMDNLGRLIAGLPTLGRVHSLLAPLEIGPEGQAPIFANALAANQTEAAVRRAATRIRAWGPTDDELWVAGAAKRLAERIAAAVQSAGSLPCQLVHGDFWDDNVLFRRSELVLVTDLDYMGTRPRVDDLALTLYFATFSAIAELACPPRDARWLRPLVNAYDAGLERRLDPAERAALPLALARQPLWSLGVWVAELDDGTVARAHARDLPPALRWAQSIIADLASWQDTLA